MSLLEDNLKKQPNWFLYIGILLFIILAGAAGWSIFNKTKYDTSTLCEQNTISEVTVLLIDKTGGFSPNQKRLLMRAIKAEIDKLKTGKRLVVYEVDDQEYYGLSKPIFDKCLPKDGSEVNQLVENKRMIEKSFNEEFLDKLQFITDNFDEKNIATSSPIIESLSDISVLYNIEPQIKLERVILISDLLQHSPNISFYKSNVENITIEEVSSSIPDLFGIDIQIYWLQRTNNEQRIQNDGLLNWWELAFEAASVNNLSIMKVR